MPAVPKEQSAEHHRLGMQSRRKGCSPTSATPALRHGDRAGGGDDDGDDEDDDDDDAAARELPIFVRFGDIKAAGIATSWEQLYRLIDKQAFPVGVRLSPNVRAWRLDDIETWLDGRPSERKQTPNPWPERRRKAAQEKRAARADQQRGDVRVP
jgi:predicted DNA-binding transcriptional regulator AlpA